VRTPITLPHSGLKVSNDLRGKQEQKYCLSMIGHQMAGSLCAIVLAAKVTTPQTVYALIRTIGGNLSDR
jgi:hypothetical protein